MSIKKFFTAFFDSISDVEARYQFKREMRSKMIEELYFNSFKGKTEFRAIVLQLDDQRVYSAAESDGQNVNIFAKVRPIDIHDFILPEPCAKINGRPPSRKEIQERIDLHPTAISDFVGGAFSVQVGQEIDCYYEIQGPEFEGAQRGLRFRKASLAEKPGYYNFDCIDNPSIQMGILGGGFQSFTNSEVTKLLSANVTLASRKAITRGGPKTKGVSRNIDFQSIMYQTSESNCRPANPNATNILEYFGRKQYNLYLRILGHKEAGGKYGALNDAGYAGKYQFSLGNINRHCKCLKSSNYKAFKAKYPRQLFSTGTAYKAFLKNSSNYNGRGGVNSWSDYINPAIGGKVQEQGMISYTSSQFRAIKSNGNVPDLNNVVHVAAFLAAAHLKGPGGYKKSKKTGNRYATGANAMYNGRDVPDGSGVYPSHYYVTIGASFKANC